LISRIAIGRQTGDGARLTVVSDDDNTYMLKMASLNKRTLFITGTSRGIGLAIALRAA